MGNTNCFSSIKYWPVFPFFRYRYLCDISNTNNNSGIKQLLDEAEHDIKNYSDRGQCYLPKRS